MKYLIKDLSKYTGLSPARIRKWQERYHILQPEQKENGYYYYSNDDLKVLIFFKRQLENGKSLKELSTIKREEILSKDLYINDFNKKELKIINAISKLEYDLIKKNLDKIYFESLLKWVKEIEKLLILTGKAWEKNFITVADEHSFSNWLRNYISSKVLKYFIYDKPIWLVCVFPGDQHELGALLHFVKLLYYKVPAKFVGMLPEHYLLQEIKLNSYKYISISVVLPQSIKKLQNLKNKIEKISNLVDMDINK